MLYSPYQLSDISLSDERLASLREVANSQVMDFEESIRVSDWERASLRVNEFLENPIDFSIAAPRLIKSFCSINPVIKDVAGQILFHRPHWLGAGQFNDLLIPCVLNLHVDTREEPLIKNFIYAVSAAAPTVDSRFIDSILGLVRNNFYDLSQNRPYVDHAVLTHFIDRLPDEERAITLQSVLWVLKELTRRVRDGEAIKSPAPREDLFGMTVTGLPNVRPFLENPFSVSSKDYILCEQIVDQMREFVQALEERIVNDVAPTDIVAYLLLLTYPHVDPVHHVPTRTAAESIVERTRETWPLMSQLVSDSLQESRSAVSFSEFVDGLESSDDTNVQLEMVLKFNQFMDIAYHYPEEFIPQQHHIRLQALDKFSQLELSTKNPLLASYIQRAENALDVKA